MYGLTPADVYALRVDEYDAFVAHYEQLRGDSG